MIDIFKLLFTILFATYVYKNSKLPTYAKLYKPLIMNGLLYIAYNTIYYYSSIEIHMNKLLSQARNLNKCIRKRRGMMVAIRRQNLDALDGISSR